MAPHRSQLQVASALCFALLGWSCKTERAPLRPAPERDAEQQVDDQTAPATGEAPEDSGSAPAEEEATPARAQDAGAEPDPQPPAAQAGVELPLALCEKYFPQSSPLPTLSTATMAFWAEDNCAIAGLFGDIDQTIDFLNYLRDWSLLILGCEAPHDVAGGASTFGPTHFLAAAPLAQADLDALIDHFMNTLTAALPLEPEDEAQVRDGLVQLSREVPLCDCTPRLDLCAEDAQPSGRE